MNPITGKILCIFPAFYPYTKYEVFLENEVSVIAPYFGKVYIFPRTKDHHIRPMPANCEVVDWVHLVEHEKLSLGNKLVLLFKTLGQVRGKFWFKKAKRLFHDLKFLAAKQKESMVLEKIIGKKGLSHAVYYSVWSHDSATTLALLAKKKLIHTLYSRAHGYDVYHFRRAKAGYVQFLDFNFRYIKKVFCASNATRDYLKGIYRAQRDRFSTIYLGVTDRGVNPFDRTQLTLLSVSNLHDVKRIHLIVAVLKNVSVNINWYHIGADPVKMEVLANGLPANIKTKFIDRLSQEDLVDFYRYTPVNLFLQFSSSEGGVPISIQEALSFGIPVLVTAVGGTPEIVNESNGCLIPVDFDVKKVAVYISEFSRNPLNDAGSRQAIKADWKERFEAGKSLKQMALSLIGQED